VIYISIDYRLKNGMKVPSVTTIIGRFKDFSALIRWAYNRGKFILMTELYHIDKNLIKRC